MTGSVAIDVAVGLSFVYFVFSLLCTGMTEWFSRFTNMRAAYLLHGLRTLFNEDQNATIVQSRFKKLLPGWLKNLFPAGSNTQIVKAPTTVDADTSLDADTNTDPLLTRLLNHPLIKNLGPVGTPGQPGTTPSYISGDTIAKALVDLLVPTGTEVPAAVDVTTTVTGKSTDENGIVTKSDDGTSTSSTLHGTTGFDTLLAAINDPNGALKSYSGVQRALNAIAKSAESDVTKFRTGVEQWYDAQMDRVSGWYKANAKRIAMLIALVIAVALNVNTIKIAETLYRDPAVRAALVSEAASASTCGAKGGSTTTVPTTGPTTVPTTVPTTSTPTPDTSTCISRLEDDHIPLGWRRTAKLSTATTAIAGKPVAATKTSAINKILGALIDILGWLITAFALTLGAPFWFDALNKLGGLRNAGPAPTSTTSS